MTHTKLNEVYRMRKPGVFCIKNEELKLAYITHSSCILKTLGSLFYKPELECLDIQNCIIEFLHESSSRTNRSIQLGYYKEQILSQGYKLVGRTPDATSYKLRIRLYNDFRSSKVAPLAYVELTARKANKLVIAIFSSLQEAEAWVMETYGSLEPKTIVPKFCINSLTMNYLEAKTKY